MKKISDLRDRHSEGRRRASRLKDAPNEERIWEKAKEGRDCHQREKNRSREVTAMDPRTGGKKVTQGTPGEGSTPYPKNRDKDRREFFKESREKSAPLYTHAEIRRKCRAFEPSDQKNLKAPIKRGEGGPEGLRSLS